MHGALKRCVAFVSRPDSFVQKLDIVRLACFLFSKEKTLFFFSKGKSPRTKDDTPEMRRLSWWAPVIHLFIYPPIDASMIRSYINLSNFLKWWELLETPSGGKQEEGSGERERVKKGFSYATKVSYGFASPPYGFFVVDFIQEETAEIIPRGTTLKRYAGGWGKGGGGGTRRVMQMLGEGREKRRGGRR